MVAGFGIQDQPRPVGGPNTRKSVSKVCCSNELTAQGILESFSHQDTSSAPRVGKGGKTLKIDDEYVLCG